MTTIQTRPLKLCTILIFSSGFAWGYSKEMLSKLVEGIRPRPDGKIERIYKDGHKELVSSEQAQFYDSDRMMYSALFSSEPSEKNFNNLTEERRLWLSAEYLRASLDEGRYGKEKSRATIEVIKPYFEKLSDEDRSEVALGALTRTRTYCEELGLPSESEVNLCNRKTEEKTSELLGKIQRWNPKDLEKAACVIAGSLVGWDPYKAFTNKFEEWRDLDRLKEVQRLLKLVETSPEFSRVKYTQCRDNPPFQIWERLSATQPLLPRLKEQAKNYSLPEPKILESYDMCPPEVAASEIVKAVNSVKTFDIGTPYYQNVNKPRCAFTLYIKKLSNHKFKLELRNAQFHKPTKTAEFYKHEELLKQLYGDEVIKIPEVQKALGIKQQLKGDEDKSHKGPGVVK